MELTQTQLKEFLHYDKHTGIFTWKVDRQCIRKGAIAGNPYRNKYVKIMINAKSYSAHILAWLYEYGSFPENQIDHINRKRNDNRLKNLRESTNMQNCRNKSLSKNNTSGINGVGYRKDRGIWHAKIRVCDKLIYLGYFKNKDNAIMARLHANRLYKFSPTHGK